MKSCCCDFISGSGGMLLGNFLFQQLSSGHESCEQTAEDVDQTLFRHQANLLPFAG